MITRDFCIRLAFKLGMGCLVSATLVGPGLNYAYNDALHGWALQATNFVGIILGGALLTAGLGLCYSYYLDKTAPVNPKAPTPEIKEPEEHHNILPPALTPAAPLASIAENTSLIEISDITLSETASQDDALSKTTSFQFTKK